MDGNQTIEGCIRVSTIAQQVEMAESALRGGDVASAERLLKKVLRSVPRHAKANELLAYIAGNRGDTELLYRLLTIATASPEASSTAWYYLGVWFLRNGRNGEARDAFKRALAMREDFFGALHDLGLALYNLGDCPGAIDAFERAISIDPRSFQALHNLGRSLYATGRHADALLRYEEALRLNPESAETWLNRGEVLHDLNRMDAALESYGKALALRPDFDEARANESLALLALGQWEAGWRAFESRWKGPAAQPRRHTAIPAWSGDEALDDKRILVWCEQGFGDTLQFSRYVPLLMERGASVVFEVQPALKPLLEANLRCSVIALGDRAPECDFQVPLLSLPLAFRTTTGTVPARAAYLKAEPAKIAHWNGRLQRADSKPKVAIACSGRITYKYETRRQVALSDFASLAKSAHLFLVQKDLRDEDRRALADGLGGVEYLGDDILDFRDGAGIVANMDLVISIDTSLAHLAGAMGKPAWLMLADVPDWRWMLDRPDSPWYPTARLFRQRRPGDWQQVLADVSQALRSFSP